jgi:hypothetical protein
MTESRDCGLDVAAYALGALEGPEAVAFESHLVACAVCRDELAAFEVLAAALPLAATPVEVPRRLRRRVLAAVRDEAAAATAGRARRVPRRAQARRFTPPRAAIGLAGAVAIALAIAAGTGGLGGGSGTRLYRAAVYRSGAAAQLRVAGARAELIVERLSAPRTGHIYEVWRQRPGHAPAPTSALFSVTRTGAADVAVPGGVNGVSRVLVTQEPAGGSTVPTSAPLIVASL